jgi:hypothetical protein
MSLQAEFQSLPAPAKSLNKSNLKADNRVNIQVARIPLKVELFNGDLTGGPVPILFSSDRSAAFSGLMEHTDITLEDLAKLNSPFYFMEHLNMEEALTYLAGPARRAKGKIAYPPPPSADQPPAKKQKVTEQPLASSTGEELIYNHTTFIYVIRIVFI